MIPHTLELDIDGIIILNVYCIFTTWRYGKQKELNCFNDVKCFLNICTNIVPLFAEIKSIQYVQFLADNQILCFSLDQLRSVYKHQKV